MKMKIMPRRILPWLLALIVLLCTPFPSSTGAQMSRTNREHKNAIRKRIAAIMGQRLKELDRLFPSSNRAPGSPVYTRIPPSPEAVREIQGYGNDAVPILSDYFTSRNERERSFAVEFMGLLGGRRIITPLRNVILRDASPNVRIQALRWLAEQQPPAEATLLIIREAANRNTIEEVRKAAKNLLETGNVDGIPKGSVPFKIESPR